MIAPRYLAALALGLLFWAGLFFGFTLLVDPYGVSPLGISIPGINKYKPRRVDIDRILKPYEVWRYQPKTVFLGTSRIHQSLDPSDLEGASFAPAYNASIPAGSLGLNISHLHQYLQLDANLRTVIVELFIYNFIGQGQEHPPKDFQEYLRNTLGLFMGGDTLWASIQTVGYNLTRTRPAFEVKPGGHYYYPPGHDAKGPFEGYPAAIWKFHESRASGMKLHQPAFDAVRELIELCRQHNVRLIFVLTPNHAQDDYYIDAVGEWGTIENWLRRLAAEDATIYSFSQPNPWVYEPVSSRMRYWYDPYHFTLLMGRAILHALAGTPDDTVPENFMVRLTTENAAELVDVRRRKVREWAERNPEFVKAFQLGRERWESLRAGPVPAGMKALKWLQNRVAMLHPAASIKIYRDVTPDVIEAKDVPGYLLKDGRLENPWGGRLVAQVFPANAWGPGQPAMYNYYFEKVPKQDCSKLVEALGRATAKKMFLINVEPSGRTHKHFPVSGNDGCSAGQNSVGLTTIAD